MVSYGKAASAEEIDYGSARARMPAPEPTLNDIGSYLQQARVQVGRYITAKSDSLKAVLRTAMLFGMLGVVGAFVGLTVVVTATVLSCEGCAEGIGQLLGGRQWAGDLIFGLGVLGLMAAGGILVVHRMIKSSRRRTVDAYEKRRTRSPAL